MHNTRGKTLTIFIIVTMVLLVSSAAIGFFLYHKETRLRQQAESERDTSREVEMKLQAELKETKRQLVILQDKNREADDKINNLMDEIELNEGLRKELKTENASLKEALEALKKDKERNKTDLQEAEKRYKEYLELLKAEQDKSGDLQNRVKELEQAKAQAEAHIEVMKADLKPYNQRTPEQQIASEVIPPAQLAKDKMELDKIVVNPNEGTRGRVLSVDKEAEFVVSNLGLKQGVQTGSVFSIYRGDEYLGDVRVSRVQEELSAADIIPPFSSRKVRKNDIVVFKP